jgi:DNA-binding NarL/FixJ family response regulator
VSKKFPIVLVIDDAPKFREFCEFVIKKTTKWVRVFVAKDGIEGVKLYKQYHPDLVLLDLKMPKVDGFDVLKALKKFDNDAKIIVTTSYDDSQENINKVIKLGAQNFLPKPMNHMVLMKTVSDALYAGKIPA